MELIDKRALMYQLHKQSQIDSKPRAIRRARRIVEEYPTVEAIPIEWIKHYMDTRLTKGSLFYSCMSEFMRDWKAEQEKQNDK